MTTPSILAQLAMQRLPVPSLAALNMPTPPPSLGAPPPSGPLPVPAGASGLGLQVANANSDQQALQRLPVPDLTGGNSPLSGPSALGAPAMPNVQGPPSQIGIDQNRLNFLRNSGSGISQIGENVDPTTGMKTSAHPGFLSSLGKGAATVGDTLLRLVAPRLEQMIPGTVGHNDYLQGRGQSFLNNDIANATGQAGLAQTQANTSLLNTEAQYKPMQLQNAATLNQAKVDHLGAQDQNYGVKATDSAAEHGLGPDGKPLPYSQLPLPLQKLEDYKAAQTEYQQASAALKAAQNDPNSPTYRIAKQRADTALKNANTALASLSAHKEAQQGRLYGTDMQGNALPGAMIADDGTPIGSAFQGNVRPTGTERNKGDMANSAAEQIATMKGIIQKNPTMFGPGYGQSTAFQKWIGSQDPDAQRFLAARTIAADHLAGTFGGRSEYALQALDDAAGQFKDNPQAALAGLDQLGSANTNFQKAGTVRTAHSNNAGGHPSQPPTAPSTHTFSLGAWQRANPMGDPNAARAAATQQGYQVVQ